MASHISRRLSVIGMLRVIDYKMVVMPAWRWWRMLVARGVSMSSRGKMAARKAPSVKVSSIEKPEGALLHRRRAYRVP